MKKLRLMTVVLATALACAFPASALAADATASLLASDLKDGQQAISIAGWNTEQDGKKELSRSVEIKLDEGAQSMADSGQLTFNMDVWGTCDECRSMKLSGSVKFLDESGNAIKTWSDSDGEYDTFRQTHTLSGAGDVPAGTVSIEAQVKNSVNLKSDLELTGTLTINAAEYDGENARAATYNIASLDASGQESVKNGGSLYIERELSVSEFFTEDLDFAMTAFFGEEARSSIDDGEAFYRFNFTVRGSSGYADDCGMLIRFFDASGNEISDTRMDFDDPALDKYVWSTEGVTYIDMDGSADFSIPAGTAYMKVESSVTWNSAHELDGSLKLSLRQGTSLRSATDVQATEPEDEAADEAVTAPTEEELANPDVEVAWAEVEEAEEQAAADEAVVADADLLTPAMRLASAATLLQENFAEELDAVDPDAVVSEETVVTVLYASKLIAEGETMDTLGAMDIEQLRADAEAWAEGAGLADLYESGVDTYRETIGVINTYLGLF